MTRIRTLVPATAIVGAAALALGPVATAAAQDDIVVTNRESVQAFLNSDGSPSEARIYDQIAAFGTGSVTIENPVSTDGLRNLDGFGGYSVEDGNMVLDLEIEGEDRFRTVSDYRNDLPVAVEPEYILNGEQVDAKDVVGKSGQLEVRYNITNVTSQPTEVSYLTGAGDEVTTTVDVPIPIVGIFETVLPPSFSAVESGQANVNGDGRGGTILKANVVLFPPLGSAETMIGYTAEISDGIVPEVQLDMTTVEPQEHYNFAGGIASYGDIYDAGRELGAGGVELDDGLGQLADGAAELMGGLELIADGTELLRAGLADEATPGSRELADGAGEAAAGANQLADGARLLEAGMAQLAGGLPEAHDGVDQLIAGVTDRLLPGIEELSDGVEFFQSEALAGVDDTVDRVHGGIGELEAGVEGGLDLLLACIGGDMKDCQADAKDDDPNLLEGAELLAGGAAQLRACIEGDVEICQPDPDEPRPDDNLLGGVTQIHDGLDEALHPGTDDEEDPPGSVEFLAQLLEMIENDEEGCQGVCRFLIGGIVQGVRDTNPTTGGPGLIPSLELARDGLAEIQDGLGQLADGAGELGAGAGQLEAGLEDLADGMDTTFRGEINAGADLFRNEVSTGAETSKEDFSDGFGQLADGVGQIDDGVRDDLLDGLRQLEAGLLDAVNGALELNDGTQQIAVGAGELADGNEQIADGANELADGIQEAADGSTELTGGAEEAAEGSEELAEGAEEAKDGFTDGFVPGFDELAGGGGTNLAVALAATERGINEGMPFGAPDDAVGTAAFSYTIAGSAGEGGQNLVRAVSAVVLMGLVAGGVALLRRRSAV